MDEDDNTPDTIPGARLNWADVAYSMVVTLQGAAEGVATGLSYLRSALSQHSTLLVERDDFKRTAGRDIEALPLIDPPTQER